MIELNSKQRKILEKAAHDLQPVVIVGGAGMTEGVIQMADKALADHELIKVKFNEYKEEKQELTTELSEKNKFYSCPNHRKRCHPLPRS